MPSDAKRTTPPAPTTTTTTPTPTTKKTPATVTTTTAAKTTKSTKTIPKTPAVQTKEDLSASCSFESKCSWINTDGDEFDWQVVFGIMGAPSRGPKSDHTIGKPGRGKYAYIGAGRPRSAGDKAWTTTIESSKATSGRCLSFWYNMNGRQTGTLNVLLRSSVDGNTTDRIIWRLSGDQGEKWQKGQTPISSKVAFNIIFEGIIADGIESAIALDDISFKQGVCPVQPKAAYPAKPTTRPPTTVDPSINCASEGLLCPGQESSGDGEIEDGSGALPTEEAVKMPKPTEGIEPPTLDCDGDDCGAKTPDTPAFKPFKCDFENYTICGFIADKSADFPWRRASGRTESKNTGPASDHTNSTKDGYYMFIETSYPRLKGESALLLTPSFSPSTASRCLSFWYHMYGSDTGSLKVYLDENGDRGEAIWTKSGNLGDRWHQSYVSLPLSRLNVPHQVVMEGVVGTSYHGDIAIDDFEINEGLCPNAGASCDFESDTCGYTNSMRGSIAWTIRKDDEGSEMGRSSTGGSQLIMMADKKGFNAVLVSPLITPSPEGDCLSFWYRLTGPDTASLEVSLQQGETEGVPIWMKKGSQVDKLVNARVTILEKKEYKIVFKGLVGDGDGNATLDDIAFTTGRCLNEGKYLLEKIESSEDI
ncbi:MAM and LDL-receptor class A domain-containing protein 1-like [Lineus longissimus]|uniref:MAM and LDL-receptor class A domain-containing protein 1-like n=1 Tax=Lineus longissimus TaxID=88925 RepID=UPI00315DBF9C